MKRHSGLCVGLYVAMGWLIMVAAGPLTEAVGTEGLTLILAGGVFYTLGVAFYLWRRMRWSHVVWHLFVLGGSVCHFLAVLWYAAGVTRAS
jgi:hemolysin III